MKQVCLFLITLTSVHLASAQYGDAYHPPNTMQLELNRQQRMAANDNAHYNNTKPSSTKSSSGVNYSSGSSYWGVYDNMNRINAAEQRYSADTARSNSAFRAKEGKLMQLLKERRLEKKPKYHEQLIQAAIDAGFDTYMAYRFFGQTPEELNFFISTNKEGYDGYTQTTVKNINYRNGDTYYGETKHGLPNGNGTYTSKEYKYTATGMFSYGDLHGPVEIKTETYSDSGYFNFGVETGIHKLEFTKTETKAYINHSNLSQTEIYWKGGVSKFTGEIDKSWNLLKGTKYYKSGVVFTGYFKNNLPYRGKWKKGSKELIGEFKMEGDSLNLVYGVYKNPKEGISAEGFFGPGMKRLGYEKNYYSGGGYEHVYYTSPEFAEYKLILFKSGNAMYLKANQMGKEYAGVVVTTDGVDHPIYYTNKDGAMDIPAGNSEHTAAAIKLKAEILAKIKTGVAEYEKAYKNIEELFK
ncbi:MAG: hypothetical protein ACOVP7_06970 [Lacibacter sp.]